MKETLALLVAVWRFGIWVVAAVCGYVYLHTGDQQWGFLALAALIILGYEQRRVEPRASRQLAWMECCGLRWGIAPSGRIHDAQVCTGHICTKPPAHTDGSHQCCCGAISTDLMKE